MTATLSPNPIADVRELLAYPFMVHALAAATVVAVVAAVVGWYMILRRQSFAGHTLSVMAFPGAAGAALAGLPAALGYYAACGAAAVAMSRSSRPRGRAIGTESAMVGTVQAVGLAAGFLLLSLDHGVLGGLETLLFGTFLGVSAGEVVTLAVVGAAVLVAVGLAARPLLLATLDPEGARAVGVPVAILDVAFLLALGATVAAASQITGVLLVFALLVGPPAAAQALTARPGPSVLLSAVLAVLVAWLALAFAYFTIYPVGFYLTTFSFGVYVLARLAALVLR